MKITQKILEQMINEAYEKYTPGQMIPVTEPDIDKPDPMDALFRIMDAVTDMALEILKKDLGDEFDYIEVEAQLSPLSNEVVTGRLFDTGRVDQMDNMANELATRYLNMKKKGQSHPGALEEAKKERTPYSEIKPWKSALVFFDKNAGAPPVPKGMVRVKAKVDAQGTFKLKKNYQQNTVQLLVYKDTIANDGSYSAQPIYIKVPGEKLQDDPEGRFFDISGWYLQKVGLANKYLQLIDSRGNILASKAQQNKWSGAQ